MATTRIKDLSKTATTVNSDANLVLDGNTGGTQKITRDNFRQDTADAFVAAPGTYNLAPINSGTGKIDATYLPTSSDTPKGAWNASTNTPTLADGSGTAGDYYDVTVAGSSDLGSGSITFTVGDVVKYNGTTWFKIDSVTNILDGVSTIDGAKAAIEIPDVGTAPNEVPLNGQLGSMAYQSADSVSVAELQVESTTGTATTQALTVTDGTDTNFVVQEDGKVGIGGNPSTTNPLRVSSSDATTPQALIQSNTSTGDAALSFNVSGRTFSLGIDKSDSEKFKISRSSELGNTDYVTIDGGNVTVTGGRLEAKPTSGTNTGLQSELRLYGHESVATRYASVGCVTTGGTDQNALGFFTSSGGTTTERVRIDEVAGDVEVLTGNVVIGTSGKGIDFSATSDGSGTMSSEVLSDYEEGSATVSFVPDGGTVTIKSTHNTIYYRKVGKLVHIAGELVVDSVSSPTGEFKISGLPYASENVNNNRCAISIHTSLLSSSSRLAAFVEKNQNFAYVRLTGSTGYGQTSATVLQANTGIVIGGSYLTA